MSAVVLSGPAQFAALSALLAGAGLPVAAGTALLANARFLPMGFAIAPSMTGGRWRRLAQATLLADASFVIGHRDGGRFDVGALLWATPVQYAGWIAGTATGALGAGLLHQPGRWGLDVLFPVFYLSLLLPELRRRPGSPRRTLRLVVAASAAVVTLALTPVAPAGLPVLAASATALLGLARKETP